LLPPELMHTTTPMSAAMAVEPATKIAGSTSTIITYN
jgi:hypothetical protein